MTGVVSNYGFIRNGHSLTVIDVPSATVVGTIDLGAHTRPHGVAWLKDGRRAAVTAEGSKHLLLVDVAARQITAAYPTLQDGSDMVVVADGDPPVAFVASTGSGSITRIFPIRVEFTHDGRHVVVTNARSDTLGVYDAAEPALVREIRLAPERDEDAGWLGTLARILGLSDAPVPIGIQPAPGRLWVALANLERVIEIDTDTWATVRTIDAGEEPDGMAWSPLSATDEGVSSLGERTTHQSSLP